MMKKSIPVLFFFSLLCIGLVGCGAETVLQGRPFTLVMEVGDPVMTVNGVKKEIAPGTDTYPVIVGGRAFVPARAILEEMGGTIHWNGLKQTVTVLLEANTIMLTIGSATASLNGEEYFLDAPPFILNGRTYLPVRFITESLGFEATWNEAYQRITVSKPVVSSNTDSKELHITITAGTQTFPAVLYDNEATRQLASLLPLTLDMEELNGNEKYFFTENNFTTAPEQPGTIHTGDLMLYGPNCIVIFYETFQSPYSYTKLGFVTDTEGLAAALGSGSAKIEITAVA